MPPPPRAASDSQNPFADLLAEGNAVLDAREPLSAERIDKATESAREGDYKEMARHAKEAQRLLRETNRQLSQVGRSVAQRGKELRQPLIERKHELGSASAAASSRQSMNSAMLSMTFGGKRSTSARLARGVASSAEAAARQRIADERASIRAQEQRLSLLQRRSSDAITGAKAQVDDKIAKLGDLIASAPQ